MEYRAWGENNAKQSERHDGQVMYNFASHTKETWKFGLGRQMDSQRLPCTNS